MIEVKNITKKYGDTVVVDDINFEVNDHEIVGFLGPNGAGKSTTMNMITGFIEPTKGKIIVNGFDISKSPIKAKKQIGYMPESVPLYNDLTVKEFISYMADLRRVKNNKKEEVKKIMEQTGLTNVQNKLIKNISRGYKQRVSLAGALIGSPDVLILDEPTVGLDPKQIAEIRALIKELGKNHTVILSSHILSEVSQICERVIIINKGRILAVDTPENLENKTKEDNSIIVTVEDKKSNMKNIDKKIKGVKSIKLIKDNQDGTMQYMISADKEVDIRKSVFEVLPKEDITIFELKKTENTLEDAFLQIIDAKESEIKAIEDKKEKQKAKRAQEIEKMDKKERKQAIKQDRKKEKQEKEELIEKEWEKDRAIEEAEKAEKKKIREIKKELKKKHKNKNEKEEKAEVKTETKSESKPEIKAEEKTELEAKAEAKTDKKQENNSNKMNDNKKNTKVENKNKPKNKQGNKTNNSSQKKNNSNQNKNNNKTKKEGGNK